MLSLPPRITGRIHEPFPPRCVRRAPPFLFLAASLALAAGGCDATGPERGGGGPSPSTADVTIRYIQRVPGIDFVRWSGDPTREGWPAPGQEVTWRAHLKNWATVDRTVEYAWELDGAEVERGSVSVPAEGTAAVDLPWSWTFDRHRVAFLLDPDDRLEEEEEGNNRLEVFTDALAVGFYVEQSLYDFHREHQGRIEDGHSTSFEDFANRHIARFNQMAEAAVYPETPGGVSDRLRLDRLDVVPDGSVPGVSVRDPLDRTLDLQWVFHSAPRILEYTNFPLWTDEGPLPKLDVFGFWYEGSLLHKLGHARSLVDVFFLRVSHGFAGDEIQLTEDGQPVAGSRYMPFDVFQDADDPSTGIVWETDVQGVMNTDYSFIDLYSAIALNRIAGERAVAGNYNAPENIGEYLWDIPNTTSLRLLDQDGAPLAGAELRMYRGAPHPDSQGFDNAVLFDDTPERVMVAGPDGRVVFDRAGGHPFSDEPWPTARSETPRIPQAAFTAIVRVEHEGRVGYGIIHVFQFVMEYWRGNEDSAELELAVEMFDQP